YTATALLHIAKATLTVTPDDQFRTYGDPVGSYSRTVTGFVNSQGPEATTTAAGYIAPSCTSDYSPTTPVANSPRTITCSGGAADNYSFDYSATALLHIAKATLTVTPDDQFRTYGDPVGSYSRTVTGFVNSQGPEATTTAAGYIAPSCTSDYSPTTPVANSPRTITCSGGAADNYSFDYSATALLHIAKATLTVTPDDQFRTYGDPVGSYSRTVTGFVNSQGPEATTTAAGYIAPSCTSDYSPTTPVANSPRTITCSGGAADNYSFDYSKTAKLYIAKAVLTVTPDDQNRTYGDPVGSYSRTVTGFVNNQGPEAATTAAGYTAPSCTSDYSPTTPVANSPRTITCSGGAADNYSFDYTATALLHIAKAPLTVTPDDQFRTYGDPVGSYSRTVTGFVNSQGPEATT